MTEKQSLIEFIQLSLSTQLIESRIREADTSSGKKVPHGSPEHIKDLELRISDLSRWRDAQKKGSEARANYSRVISRLKAELKSAQRKNSK